MSGTPGIPDHDRYGGDAAAYAMGALEPAEAEAFREHLKACAICQEDVASFTGVVRALPLATNQYQVPSGVRRRVMHEIRSEHQTAKPSGRVWLMPRRAIAGVCVALLLGVAVLGGEQLGGRHAPTHVYAASVGDASVKVSGDRAELIIKHLPQPGTGKIYEVWLKRGSRAPTPAGALFGVNSSGRGDVVVPGSVRGADLVMVTAEPDGGSPAPTSNPVVVASLS
jgi:Anti-sigma-K factor rskA/Putative zinc-finger